MSLVVRFAVDACSPRPEPKATTSTLKATRTSSTPDDISDLLSGLKVSPEFTRATSTATAACTPATTPDIIIVHGGYQVPQGSIMELTTRSERNAQNMEWNEYYPQLFLSQTAQHVLGVHQKGTFSRIEERSLESPEMRRVAASCQRTVKDLRAMLQVIQDLVVEHGERGRLSLLCEGGVLKVYERTSQESCLPDDVMGRF